MMKPQISYPRVTAVKPLPEKRLLVTFSTGETKVYDCKPLLEEEVFRPMNYPAASYGVSEERCFPFAEPVLEAAQGRRTQHDLFDPSTGSGSSRGRSRGDNTQGHGEGNRTMTNQCHFEAESRRFSLQIRSKLRGIRPK